MNVNAEVDTPYHLRFHELLRFVRFDEEDARLLGELAAHASPYYRSIATRFYERTREHEDAHRVFQNEAQIDRLHDSLVAWLGRLLTGPYDLAYVARTAHIGRRHVQVGLPERFMYGAMSVFRCELMHIAFVHAPDLAPAICQSLNRLLDVELAIMCLTYSEAERERQERRERREEVQTELELEWHRCAVEAIDDVLIGLDAERRIVMFNRQASQLTGFSADEVLGESLDKLLSSATDDRLREVVAEVGALAPGTSRALERVSVPTRTGSSRQFDGHVLQSRVQDDTSCTFVIGRDVTRALATEARLRRSEKLAAIGTLAAGLAHEIRNPLNGAQLHLTFIQRGLSRVGLDDASELVAATDVVSGEIRRLSGLVSEFLEFARPHALSRKQVVVQTLCTRCVELVRDVAKDASVALHCDLPGGLITAEIDENRIEQVLLNLLRNAIEAAASRSTDGHGTVRLKLSRRPDSAVCFVEDDGPGLTSDSPIWDAFYSTKESGTGLGLAIVHRIVTDHGGNVSVESQPGNTSFRVELPLLDPEKLPKSMRPIR